MMEANIEADKEGSPVAVVVVYSTGKSRILMGVSAEEFVNAEMRMQLAEGPRINGWPRLNWTEVPTSKLPEILDPENNHH